MTILLFYVYWLHTCQETPDDCECHGDEGGEELVDRLAARRDGLDLHAVVGVVEQGGVDDAQTLVVNQTKVVINACTWQSIDNMEVYISCSNPARCRCLSCVNFAVTACRESHPT